MRSDALSAFNVAYANDLLAMIDPADQKTIRLMDPLTGKQLGTLQHSIEVEHIALSQVGDLSRRRLVLVDKNRDLYISPVQGAQELYKLHIMVDAMRWNDCNNSLAAVADGLLLVWYYPEVIYMDRDLLSSTISKQPAFDWGKTAEIVEFRDTRVQACASGFTLAPPTAAIVRMCDVGRFVDQMALL